jgi:hypothetical protein
LELESENRNYVGGDIGGGTIQSTSVPIRSNGNEARANGWIAEHTS